MANRDMSFKDTEPARLAEIVRGVLVGLVGLGWVALDNATVNSIATLVAVAGSWALTKFVRDRVTPLAKGD